MHLSLFNIYLSWWAFVPSYSEDFLPAEINTFFSTQKHDLRSCLLTFISLFIKYSIQDCQLWCKGLNCSCILTSLNLTSDAGLDLNYTKTHPEVEAVYSEA